MKSQRARHKTDVAMASSTQQQGYTDYRVKLAKEDSSKKYHVMRFKPPHKCDLEKLMNPTLDRQVKKTEEEGDIPESGEGSEYGRKWREEARKRKRGYASRKKDPDEMPWVLKEKKRGGTHFIGRKEGTVNKSSSYFILSVGQDGAFEAYPIKNWYDFVPPVKYNYLDADEAEERFEKRNKTLNYFSIMLSKKMKDQGEEGEESKGPGEEREGDEAAGSSKKKWRKKQPGNEAGLMLTDSSSGVSSDDSENDDSANKKKGEAWKKKKLKRKVSQENESEAGEETDEGEVESREVDYMSESSSDSEQEFQAKQAIKEAPKDDEEVERQEEGEIDKGFTESSSSEEDNLTEEGKEIKALLNLQSASGKDVNSDEEEEEEEEYSMEGSVQVGKPTTPTSGAEGKGSPKKKHGKSSKHGVKREREQEKTASQPTASREAANEGPSSSGTAAGAVVLGESGEVVAEPQPPSKRQKTEFSLSTITEEEVKRYLLRRPITSKELVRKFTGKKTEMDKNRIVEVLSRIINSLKDVEKQTIKGKMYLSLRKQTEQ